MQQQQQHPSQDSVRLSVVRIGNLERRVAQGATSQHLFLLAHDILLSLVEDEIIQRSLAEWTPPSPTTLTEHEFEMHTCRRRAGEETMCVVCQVQMKSTTMVTQIKGCNHKFHTRCIRRWLKKERNTCPVCNGEVGGAQV